MFSTYSAASYLVLFAYSNSPLVNYGAAPQAKAFPKPLSEHPGVASPAWPGPALPIPPAEVGPKLAPPPLEQAPTLGPPPPAYLLLPIRPSRMALADLFVHAKRERIGPNLLTQIPF